MGTFGHHLAALRRLEREHKTMRDSVYVPPGERIKHALSAVEVNLKLQQALDKSRSF